MHGVSDGFFNKWFDSISEILRNSGKLNEISAHFASLKSDNERVIFGLNLQCVHDVIRVRPSYQQKSAEESARMRNNGNKLFQKNHYHKALEVYSRSILVAPFECDGKELCLAFANRSAVLFHLKEYEQCLRDIQQALNYGYPEELKYKLFDRQGKCLVQLGRTGKACDCFLEAREALNSSRLDCQKMEEWSRDLEREICKSQQVAKDSGPSVLFSGEQVDLPKVMYGQNKQYVSASSAVDVVMSDSLGRHLVARRDINVGDTLVIEKPYASVLLPKHLGTHCYNCLKRVTHPLPCVQCSSVRYCSEACARQSWDSYHSIECQYLDLIHGASIGANGHLALRIIVKAGFKFLKAFVEGARYTSAELGCGHDRLYSPCDYAPIYCLLTHADDRSPGDLFRRTLVAIFLLKVLQGGPFFGEELCSAEDEAFIGGLILRHLQSNPCNAHEVSELQLNLDSVSTSETEEIAAGIYATLSLFNHSCDPSVTRNFYGDTCVVRAIRNIPRGCEISDNYGTLCALSVRTERREKLKKQYYFTCKCKACEDKFPLYSEIPSTACPVYKCEYCHIPLDSRRNKKNEMQGLLCTKCHSLYNLEEMRSALRKSEESYRKALDALLLEADAQNTLLVFVSHLRLLEKLICRPWKDYNNCQEAIKQCYNIMGNCHATTSTGK